MRNYVLPALLTLAFLAVPFASADAGIQSSIVVVPESVPAGTTGTIQVTLANTGLEPAEAVRFEVRNLPDGITIEGAGRNVGALGAADQATYTLQYTADESVLPGRYLIPLRIEYCKDNAGTCEWTEFTQSVSLRIIDDSQIEVRGIEPSRLERAQTEDLQIWIHNPSSGSVDNVIATWSVADDAVLPFGQDARFRIPQLAPHEHVNVTVPVVVANDAQPGPLAFDFVLTYRDITGFPSTLTARAGIVIGGPALFDAGDASIEDARLSLTLANIGQNGADSVVIRALDANGEALGTSFLGIMDPGDYATIAIDLSSGADVASIDVQYTDELGARQQDTIPMAVSQPPAPVIEEGSFWTTAAIGGAAALAIVAIVIVVMIRRRRE